MRLIESVRNCVQSWQHYDTFSNPTGAQWQHKPKTAPSILTGPFCIKRYLFSLHQSTLVLQSRDFGLNLELEAATVGLARSQR